MHTLLPEGEGRDALRAFAKLAADASAASSRDEYEEKLELIADAAVLYAATRPLVPTDEDMVDSKWEDHCIDVCDLQPEEDEEEEDEYYGDED